MNKTLKIIKVETEALCVAKSCTQTHSYAQYVNVLTVKQY